MIIPLRKGIAETTYDGEIPVFHSEKILLQRQVSYMGFHHECYHDNIDDINYFIAMVEDITMRKQAE